MVSFFRMSARGQAAVTDALFLLVIITSLTGFLFLFSGNYGKGIADQVNRNDSFEFVSSALKTIMYQSVPRDSAQFINVSNPDPGQEIDYLMAILKEDYADDLNLTTNTKRLLARSTYQVMRPVADTQDYVFAINTAQKYVLMILWRTKFQTQLDANGKPIRFQNAQVDPHEPHEMFFCDPSLADNALQRLFLRVGTVTQTQALVNMVEFTNNQFLLSNDATEIRAGVTLATWTATTIPDSEWQTLNCEKIDVSGIV